MDEINDISIADRKRFATCYQHAHDNQNVDWASASAAHDPKVKEASFKTVTSRALKALKESTGEAMTEGNLNRLALCYLFSNDKQGVDWPVAAKAYDSKVKFQSFRTVVQRAVRKYGYDEAAAKKKTAAKRKADADDGVDDAELDVEEAKPAKKTKAAATKKAMAPRTAKTKAKASIKEDSEVDEEDSDGETKKASKAKKKPHKSLKTLEPVKEEKHESADELAD